MKNLTPYNITMWAGTPESWQEFEASYHKGDNAKVASPDDMMPPLWERVGSTAIVPISGSLVAGSAGFWRLFGMTGYDDIAEALNEAVADSKVKSIMLNVRSGGGMVDGVGALAQYMGEVDAVKPVMTYASGTMASAAYWLGSTGRHILASDTSVVGSIGVLRVMAERSQQLKDDGINVKVIRSGKYKALGNPYEPMSDLAIEQAQSHVDYIDDLFTSHIAQMRGVDQKTVVNRMGQGREFIGSQAFDVGLVDQITDMRGALAVAETLGSLNSAANVTRK